MVHKEVASPPGARREPGRAARLHAAHPPHDLPPAVRRARPLRRHRLPLRRGPVTGGVDAMVVYSPINTYEGRDRGRSAGTGRASRHGDRMV
jgi:hypothetical protein